MRISDWSSDVCSSDLQHDHLRVCRAGQVGEVQLDRGAGEVAGRNDALARRVHPAQAVALGHVDVLGKRTEVDVVHGVAPGIAHHVPGIVVRSEEHTSELQSLMRISYAVFCLKKKNKTIDKIIYTLTT